MRTYPEYKQSDHPLIGLVPEHWGVIPNGAFFQVKSIKNTKDEQNLSVYRDYGVIPRDSRDDNHNRVSEDISNYKLVEVGDFVLNKMKCWMGSLGVSDYRGIVSPSYTVCEPIREIHRKYFHYLLRSRDYIKIYESLSYGVRIGQWELRFHDFKQIKSLYPPLPEQKQISNYLDRKTQQIDDLIEKTERKIELLKEQRSSLINHYVTKGLDPNVEMKDSGVEWIGEMPEHWSLSKLKYETDLIVDGTHFTPNYQDDGVPFLRVKDLLNDEIDRGKTRYISRDEHETLIQRCCPQKGDLLLSKNGTIGRTKVVDWDWEFSIFVSLCLIRLKNTYSPDLLSYFFQSALFDTQISEGSKQSTVTNLHLDKIREFILINSPIEEQFHIVSHLDKETSKVDQMVDIETKRIELLKEYRQSLVSNVVTGKIDVREEVLQ
jgi:type I restriction enzyme, S subunit